MQFKKLFYSSLLTTIVAGVTGIFLAYKNYGIWALVLHYIVSSYLMCMIMFFSVNWKPRLSFSTASLKNYMDMDGKFLCQILLFHSL